MKDKIPSILVTGASRGLGKGVALALAKAGFSVGINYVNTKTAADQTVNECNGLKISPGQKFIPLKGNISNAIDRSNIVKEALKELGQIDGLVNPFPMSGTACIGRSS